MAKQLETEFGICFVEPTPLQAAAYERAMNLLANMVRRLYEQEQMKKMEGAQHDGGLRAANATSCLTGLPAGMQTPVGSSPPPAA